MNPAGPEGGGEAVQIAPPKPAFSPDDPSAWSSGEVLRLLLTPAIVAALFAGGIYWVKLQLPAGRPGQDEASTVQVHLLAQPTPVPIPMPEASQATTASIATRTDASASEPDHTIDDATPTPLTSDPAPMEAPAQLSRATPSLADAPPNVDAIRFQQALLRHVARYQRYPKAARAARLYGSVGTIFSMRRDGTVTEVRIRSSSGQQIFDKEAIETILRAQPLPPIPPGLPEPLTVETTLVFEPS